MKQQRNTRQRQLVLEMPFGAGRITPRQSRSIKVSGSGTPMSAGERSTAI